MIEPHDESKGDGFLLCASRQLVGLEDRVDEFCRLSLFPGHCFGGVPGAAHSVWQGRTDEWLAWGTGGRR